MEWLANETCGKIKAVGDEKLLESCSIISRRMEIDSRMVEEDAQVGNGMEDQDEELVDAGNIQFRPLTAQEESSGSTQYRRVRIPPHRFSPLQANWQSIISPLVEHMKLAVRFNVKTRSVEMKTTPETVEGSALARSADFVAAFAMGFEVADAIALLRIEDLYLESFEVCDVRKLSGDHLSRAIGRVAGQGGKTKHAIENATRTRIVVADRFIHILGSFQNIKIARDAICRLILGAPPGKVYNQMRGVAHRLSERF